MTERLSHRDEIALGWLIRSNDSQFAEWEDFTLWLEADPANADAYHRLAQAELDMRPLVHEAMPVAKPPAIATPRRWSVKRLSSVAAAVLAVGLSVTLAPRLFGTDRVTGPGERLEIALGSSDRLILNGNTRITLSGLDQRNVRLDHGQILFDLNEKGGRAVAVSAGDLELTDIGTVFDVTREATSTRVEVSEGAVLAKKSGQNLRLLAGSRLDAADGGAQLVPKPVDRSSVGGWASGQLAYDNEPLPNVLGDLRRATGIQFEYRGPLAGRVFTGTLSVAGVKRNPRLLEPLLGVTMTKRNGGWSVQTN